LSEIRSNLINSLSSKKKKLMKKILLFLSIIAISCNSNDDNADNPTNCTEEFVYGLNVNVKDAATDAVLQEGVLVKAVDGSYVETLETVESIPTFLGAGERAGSYVITVSKDGYQTFTSPVVTVKADICHVLTETLNVELQPE
jgi:hypothetical protein